MACHSLMPLNYCIIPVCMCVFTHICLCLCTRRAKLLLCALQDKQHWRMHKSTCCSGRLCDHVVAANVSKTFKQVNIHKATGPDGVPGRVLRAYADQLARVFTDIFKLSLAESVIPTCFKQTTIVPVIKNTKVTWLNDYWPVALTSVAMKCLKAGHGSHQHHYPRNPRPSPIYIPPQQIHRWRNLYSTQHCPFSPGQKEHLCENAAHWLQPSTIMPSKLITKLMTLELNTSLCN
jgi:hypothetical protein